MLLKPLLTKDCPKKVRGVIEKIRKMGTPWSIGTIKKYGKWIYFGVSVLKSGFVPTKINRTFCYLVVGSITFDKSANIFC
jgi:hypothetical protein